jgi:hypothetical protein
MCCLTASAADDGAKQNGAPRLPANFDNLDGIDDYHADRLVEIEQPSGAWKIIWKQGGLPSHLVFEASEKTCVLCCLPRLAATRPNLVG